MPAVSFDDFLRDREAEHPGIINRSEQRYLQLRDDYEKEQRMSSNRPMTRAQLYDKRMNLKADPDPQPSIYRLSPSITASNTEAITSAFAAAPSVCRGVAIDESFKREDTCASLSINNTSEGFTECDSIITSIYLRVNELRKAVSPYLRKDATPYPALPYVELSDNMSSSEKQLIHMYNRLVSQHNDLSEIINRVSYGTDLNSDQEAIDGR